MPLTRMPPVRAIAGLVILRYDNLMVLVQRRSSHLRNMRTRGRSGQEWL